MSSTRSSLWLGPDHILYVESNGYAESYKRFYFRDIQSLTLRATKHRLIWNCILAPISLLFYSLSFATGTGTDMELGLVITMCTLGTLVLVISLINTFLGTGCVGEIRTAVQTETLPSLCRIRQARRILAQIRPLIAAAQGQLSSSDVAAALRGEEPTSVQPTPSVQPQITEQDLPPTLNS
ncbi:MAG TPA: hypothetical protein VMF06_01260 [Candidatus Limnocylindria bacterium]|nr:hypothetical protein [Candidatus Limnocylindria bacterium]